MKLLGLAGTLISTYLIADNAALASGDRDLDKDQVHVLNEANFDVKIEENAFVLVMFHAPWCQHCETLAPAFSEVSDPLLGVTRCVHDMTYVE